MCQAARLPCLGRGRRPGGPGLRALPGGGAAPSRGTPGLLARRALLGSVSPQMYWDPPADGAPGLGSGCASAVGAPGPGAALPPRVAPFGPQEAAPRPAPAPAGGTSPEGTAKFLSPETFGVGAPVAWAPRPRGTDFPA